MSMTTAINKARKIQAELIGLESELETNSIRLTRAFAYLHDNMETVIGELEMCEGGHVKRTGEKLRWLYLSHLLWLCELRTRFNGPEKMNHATGA